jgi:predicted AlkP superfamily pyrophosphatase or phosphodiesterase
MKKSLGQIAVELDEYLENLPEDQELTEEIFKEFESHSQGLSEKTDNWISFLASLKGRINLYRDSKMRFEKHLKAATNLSNRTKEYLKFVITKHPHLKFEGEDGVIRLWNSPKKLVLLFDVKDETYRNVIPPDAVDDIDPKYKKEITLTILDKQAVHHDLASGRDVGFAEFHQDKHLRVV